jgi:transcriptional/translational regulatory protein YebC/TACO1
MGITPKEAKLTMIPKTTVELEAKALKTMLTLMDMLDDDEDVQEVFNNVELTDEAMEAAMAD